LRKKEQKMKKSWKVMGAQWEVIGGQRKVSERSWEVNEGIPDICHQHHQNVGGEKICHVEKFQNSIKKNLSCGEISEFYKECPKVRMWRKNDKYQV